MQASIPGLLAAVTPSSALDDISVSTDRPSVRVAVYLYCKQKTLVFDQVLYAHDGVVPLDIRAIVER